MVLPGSSSATVALLIISIFCFGLWPLLFRPAVSKWRFELFSMDFAAGAVLLSVLAAYTLGTRGSDLGFSDSMLVAGQRAEAVAVIAGMSFALGNICLLATISLIGLANASLLTFSIFGCGLSLLHLGKLQFTTSIAGFVVLLIAAALAIRSARVKRGPAAAIPSPNARLGGVRPNVIRSNAPQGGLFGGPISASTKGIITGVLAGLSFVGVIPLLGLAQGEQLGIGAYGGVLLASLGLFGATVCLNFFFLNISLEGGTIGYGAYIAGKWKDHMPGILAGVIWAVGALAIYTAYTGTPGLSPLETWLPPFTAALIAAIAGIFILRKAPASAESMKTTWISAVLFVAGIATLFAGFR